MARSHPPSASASPSSSPPEPSELGGAGVGQYITYDPSSSRGPVSPRSAGTPHPLEDTRLLDHTHQSPLPTSSGFSHRSPPARNGSFASSPLNPSSSPPNSMSANPFASRPGSRSSSTHLLTSPSRLPSDGEAPPVTTPRGSLILYRLADLKGGPGDEALLLPPRITSTVARGNGRGGRDSVISTSGDSMLSFATDSKYPSGLGLPTGTARGLVPYAYDPALDELADEDEEDRLHDPEYDEKHPGSPRGSGKGRRAGETNMFPWRGLMNVSVLVLLIAALLALFVFYPMWRFYRDKAKNERVEGNIRINATGQSPVLFQMPDLIDTDTPDTAKTRTGYDGQEYELVFSDEFNVDGRTFYPGDDPFWEAVDLWYGATADLEWYDPQQVTTRDGKLVITMDSTATAVAGMTPGSTAPFTVDENHNLTYRSGMLQSWNKFCFTTGYIEVSVTMPGPNEGTTGYWPGVWTMGNLARPGYAATTDGMWPYTYDSCDVGTFPNQTDADGLGPAAALHSDASRQKYNFDLSWLPGQRLSACSCPGADHPGPSYDKGRGAPEIDIFEAEHSKDTGATWGVVSQSAQFAPFSHDYTYLNDTQDEWWIYNTSLTNANNYKGSAVQQAVSCLTRLPSDMYQGSGANFKTLGFEYWSDPDNRGDGYIAWQVDGQQSYRLGAASVGPDQGTNGSGVGARLIPEEPMSIILNLGISPNWQTIDLSTMIFPAEFQVDYVRVYQRKGQTNVGCNPSKYPTADYIDNHLEAYQNVNMTSWQWDKPKNRLFEGTC